MMTYEKLKRWLASRPACCAGGREAASKELNRRRLTKREIEALDIAARVCGYAFLPVIARSLLEIKERFK